MEIAITNIAMVQLNGEKEINLFKSAITKVIASQKKIGFRDKLISNEEFELLKEIKLKL
jgi:hypothetical protein